MYRHIDGVAGDAWFSEDGLYRYKLETTLMNCSEKPKTACVVMQNPSYANEEIADKSVQFMEKVVFEKGFKEFEEVGRLIVVNQFAFIQTNDFEGLDSQIGSENDQAIKDSFSEADIIVVAWGCSNRFTARQEFIAELLKKEQNKGKQGYRTRTHPSRGKYDGFIVQF